MQILSKCIPKNVDKHTPISSRNNSMFCAIVMPIARILELCYEMDTRSCAPTI